MMNSLDLMVIVIMVVAAVGILALSLMLLAKNDKVKNVSLYIVSALGIYAASIGIRIFGSDFIGQAILSVVLGIAAIVAVVLNIVAKDNVKFMRAAKILAAVSLVAGMVNAIS